MKVTSTIAAVLTAFLTVAGMVACTQSQPAQGVSAPSVADTTSASASPTQSGSPSVSPSPAHAVPPPSPATPAPQSSTHDCKVLRDRGLSYEQVLIYWFAQGSPKDMDDDGDGWPCETVYGERNAPAPPGGGTHDCKALAAQGYAYDDVLTYWLALGSPKDMDDDGDGWPCETVYGEQGTQQCDPNYSGACVPVASDVDCAGGGDDGPAYVRGPVRVIGNDIYHLDSDGDGIACE